ncbi:hypothetical protein ACWEJ6_44600 [Nonomuraea sp. NPDC004702]
MTETNEPYSFARAWFATQPPKVERLARQRYRWVGIRYHWPASQRIKTEYRRRRRSR